MNSQEDVVDSVTACEMLNVSRTNLRQFVFRKVLVPVGKQKRRSLFKLADIEALKVSRLPSIPSAE